MESTMKPRHFLFGLAGFSGLAIALIYFFPREGVDITSTHTDRSTVPARPALVAEIVRPSLNQESKNDSLQREADPLAELKRRLDDPRQRNANLLRAKLNVEQTHGRLFQRLRNLPPETLDRLKDILAETQLAMERGALPDRIPVDDGAAKAASENLGRIAKDGDDQVHALLGDDGYAQYSLSRQTEPYRESIDQVTNIMRARGAAVTEDMQERVLDGYTRALVAAAKISASDTTPESFRTLSESARQELRLKQQLRFDEILASTMSGILSPTEYKLFMESQFAQDRSVP